jgi:hypothetical protein
MSNVTAVPLRPVKRSYLVYIVIALVLAAVAAFALANRGPTRPRTASGLEYMVLKPGAPGAPHPTDTDVALVQYEGKLLDGTTFDKSERPTPMPVAAVVPGFSEALKLMSKGAKYRFWLPPALGYGERAVGPIPANSTLVFDVELLDFLPEQTLRQQMMQQQMMAPGGPGAAVPPGGPEGR